MSLKFSCLMIYSHLRSVFAKYIKNNEKPIEYKDKMLMS